MCVAFQEVIFVHYSTVLVGICALKPEMSLSKGNSGCLCCGRRQLAWNPQSHAQIQELIYWRQHLDAVKALLDSWRSLGTAKICHLGAPWAVLVQHMSSHYSQVANTLLEIIWQQLENLITCKSCKCLAKIRWRVVGHREGIEITKRTGLVKKPIVEKIHFHGKQRLGLVIILEPSSNIKSNPLLTACYTALHCCTCYTCTCQWWAQEIASRISRKPHWRQINWPAVALLRKLAALTILSTRVSTMQNGPDGFRNYCHDLRKDELFFPSRNFRGGGMIV